MDLKIVANRLQEHCPDLKYVGRAVEFANIEKVPPSNYPAAYILPLHEKNDIGEVGMLAGMSISKYFGVCVAVRNMRDASGNAAQDELDTVRKAVFAALLDISSETMPQGFPELNYVDGNLIGLMHSAVWWQDNFLTKFILRF